jgi:hypothetical protein
MSRPSTCFALQPLWHFETQYCAVATTNQSYLRLPPPVPTDRTLGGPQRQPACNFFPCRKFPTKLLLNVLPGFFLGVKRLGREVNRSPSSSADIKNGWRYTPPPPMCLYCVSTDNFNFTFFQPWQQLNHYTACDEKAQVILLNRAS